jgi:hypothetical protein
VTLADVHLADEAVAAYVDDALSPVAHQRAQRHLRCCLECRAVVEAQREAKVLLAAAPDPDLPRGLLARLRDIPMTTDLPLQPGGLDLVLAANGDQLGWVSAPRAAPPGPDPRLAVATEPRPAGTTVLSRPLLGGTPGDAAPTAAAARRPGRGRGDRGRYRPGSYPSSLASRQARRGRRGLAGALAGLAFGVIASAASSTSPGAAAPPGQLGPGGASTVPVIDRRAPAGSPLELNTLRVSVADRREGTLADVARRGR